MKNRFVLVDVFADRALAGNPLAVFPEAESLSEPTMRTIAREMDHAATAFLQPATLPGAAFRLRIFSPDREIPFAGHPALGAHFVHALESRLPLAEPVTRVAHEGSSGGLVTVEIRPEEGRIGTLRLTQQAPALGKRLPEEEVQRVAEGLELAAEDIYATNQPVKVASTGLPVLIVPVATLDALSRARPRFELLRRVLEGLDATVVYAFTKETRDAQSAAHARAFDVPGGYEIPGAGAAAGALAAYLVSHAAVTVTPVTLLVIEQGHAVQRPSTLYAEVHSKAGGIGQVIVGGRVMRVGEGYLDL